MASLNPVRISGRDMEILYRHITGMANKDIADDLGISAQTVSNTINSQWAKNEIAALHARTMEQLSNGTYSPLALARAVSNEALAIQVALMRSPNVKAHVRARIADSILDRAGYKPATKLETLDLNDAFEKMSQEELDEYATSGTLPARLAGTQAGRFLGKANTDIIADYSSSTQISAESESDVIEIDVEDNSAHAGPSSPNQQPANDAITITIEG